MDHGIAQVAAMAGHEVWIRDVEEGIDRTPVEVTDSPGFASSRLGVALGAEAMRMVQEDVATPRDIDAAMELGYNHPMGPIELGKKSGEGFYVWEDGEIAGTSGHWGDR
jgi:3-hydroxybutyryl-CoA dehydrogenase